MFDELHWLPLRARIQVKILAPIFKALRGLAPKSGASIPPKAMMHFLPLFQISPYFGYIFRLRGKFSKFYFFPFSRKISRFSSAKISDDLFLVIDHTF